MLARGLLVILLVVSSSAYAKECVLSWTASVSDNVAGYTVYKNDKSLKKVKGLSLTFKQCLPGKFTVTATNEMGMESVKSKSVTTSIPLPPRSIKFKMTGIIEFIESN